MILSIEFGLFIGFLVGTLIGMLAFRPLIKPRPYRRVLDESADTNESIVIPRNKPAAPEMRPFLKHTESWTRWPDYERVGMVNRLLRVFWPTAQSIGLSQAYNIARVQLERQVFSKYSFVEDIILGNASMKKMEWPESMMGKPFTPGDLPPHLGGIKNYKSTEDAVVMEVPVLWGSECKFHAGAIIRFGSFRFYVPVEVSNLCFKVDCRVTVKPLVETMPCIGGVNISLLRVPHLDLSMKLFRGIDLMALPVIRDLAQYLLKAILVDMVVYPSSMSFPLMPNYGLPLPPKGALSVTLLSASNLPCSQSHIRLNTRKHRIFQTQTVRGVNPVYNEDFTLIVDNYESSALKLVVRDGDAVKAQGFLPFGAAERELDPITGRETGKTVFKLAQFIKVPQHEVYVSVPLRVPVKASPTPGMGWLKDEKAEEPAPNFLLNGRGDAGVIRLKVTFHSFAEPVFDDDPVDEKASWKGGGLPTTHRTLNHVPDTLMGVLTVTLIRCTNLPGEAPSSFVRLYLSGASESRGHKSSTVKCDNDPRWGEKFEFVMIPAHSDLVINVYEKGGFASNFLKVFSSKNEHEDRIGRLRVPVKDVALNGKLKDIWVLQDSERAKIELELSWQSCLVESTA